MNAHRRPAGRAIDRGSAWRRIDDTASAALCIHDETIRPYADLPLGFADRAIDDSFVAWRTNEQRSYLYRYRGRAIIEPEHGFLLTDWRTLLPASMPYHFYVGLPSFADHLSRKLTRRRATIREDTIISLRDFEDRNYYHFYNDVLGKLALLERFGIDRDAPLVISRRLYDRPFFRRALRRSKRMRALRWLVQDDFYIEAREVIFCQAMPHDRRNFDLALDLLDASAATTTGEDLRVFLTRRPPRARRLANADEVERTCADLGFRVVDADRLTLDEQIALFARTRHLVGIHGAGLTNIIFRRGAPLSVLEIFPPTQVPPHYCHLALEYDFNYDAMIGTDGRHITDDPASFKLDIKELRLRSEGLLSA